MPIDKSTWDAVQLDPPTLPPRNFVGLTVEEGGGLIKRWFFRNFEDPAHHTPYESNEGGYQYIWGGPYDAYDEIRDALAGIASDEMIDAAVRAIEQDGREWAPHERRIQPFDDEWLDQTTPKNPHSVFMASYHQTGNILAKHGGDDGDHLINRMVFAQQVSALEAYLGDTLLNAVTERKDVRDRLLNSDKNLKETKVSLADISANPRIVEENVAKYLRSIIFHKLEYVDFLYRTALNVRVLGEKEDDDRLFKAIQYRHDCVHRNGMDKDGNRIEIFTKEYVQEIADAVRSLVDRIEGEIYALPF